MEERNAHTAREDEATPLTEEGVQAATGEAPADGAGAPTDGRPSTLRRIRAWIENFWYHHKFGTCVGVFLIIAGIITGTQLFGRNRYDVQVLYAGPWLECSTASRVAALEDAIGQVMQDYDGNGQKSLAYRPIFLMNDQQIADLRAEYEGREEEMPYINPTLLQQNTELLDSEFMTGETVICFLDPSIFEDLLEGDWTVSLTDPVEEGGLGIDPSLVPENPYGNHGVYLRDLDFGSYFTGMSAMPEDTVLCVRRTSVLTGVWAPEESREAYGWSVDLVRRIFAFVAPEAE